MVKRHRNWYLPAVLIVAGLLYAGAFLHGIMVPEVRQLPDSYEYLTAARNLAEHGTLYAGGMRNDIDYSLYTRRPPGYPFLLCLLSRIHPSTSVPVIFQFLLSFAGGLLLWKLMGSMGVPPVLKTAGLAWYLLYPSQIIYSQMIMAEIPLQFLLLASAWFLHLHLKAGRPVFIILCDLCLAGAVLCKPVVLYFWIPCLLIHILLFRRRPRKIILAAALIPVLTITLWSWRNYQVTGVFHYSSLKTSHLKFTMPNAPQGFSSRSKEDFSQEMNRAEESAAGRLLNPRNTGKILRRGFTKSISFYIDPGRFDIYRFIPLPDGSISSTVLTHWEGDWKGFFREIPVLIIILLGLLTGVNTLVLLAFLPFPLLRSQDLIMRLFLVLLLLYMSTVSALAATGAARYRMAIEPLLICGAAVAVSSWRNRAGRKKPAGSS